MSTNPISKDSNPRSLFRQKPDQHISPIAGFIFASKPLLVGGDDLRPIKRVLVAYRGGSQSQETLDWASRFYHTLNTELIILVVAEDQPGGPDEPAQFNQRGLAGYRIIHRSGKPAAEIVAAAEQAQADLIIMGRYRQSTPMEWLTGSVPDQVLRNTRLPVLIV